MTEKEILELQEQADNKEFMLVLVGSFFRAYGHGAFALARATGYRVVRKERKQGEVLVCGFPADRLEQVTLCLQALGGEVEQLQDGRWLFRGIDGTPDESLVSEPKAKPQEKTAPVSCNDWLASAVRSFNLSLSTPMDAMQFIGSLQQELHEHEVRQTP